MKSYIISVSYCKGCYRHIRISADDTLYELHEAIIEAFGFDDDHEHAFFMDNHIWMPNQMYVSLEFERGDRLTKDYALKKIGLEKGKAFKYIFDYGEEHRFQCRVLQELNESTYVPQIVREVGEAPSQYRWHDDDFEDLYDGEESELLNLDALSSEDMAEFKDFVPFSKETLLIIRNYLNAAANLYGLISSDKVLDMYNLQNEPIDAESFLKAITLIELSDVDFFIAQEDKPYKTAEAAVAGMDIVAQYLAEDDDPDFAINELRRMQAGKPYKQLPKNEFLKYADYSYFPSTPARTEMIRYLQKKKKDVPYPAKEFCDCIQSIIAVGAPFSDIISIVQNEGFVLESNEAANEFVALLQNLNNNTYMHANCGYTPLEMIAVKENDMKPHLSNQLTIFDGVWPEQPTERKPSRNGFCPCGSGKKYKRCCGKDK